MGGGPLPFLQGMTLQIGIPAQIQLPPRVFRGRLTGMLFDTDRSFLLPSALHGIRRLKHFYDDHPGLEVLVVGHTDLRADDEYNRLLSEERAASIAAYLQDQVQVWLDFYHAGAPANRRWGVREDQQMLAALTDGTTPFYAGPFNGQETAATQAAVHRFQDFSNSTRGTSLNPDGFLGDNTRRELITVYMQQDDTTLPPGTVIRTHGCGEMHPEIPQQGDVQANRRVEIFLFEGAIDPPVPARCPPRPGCTEQPVWVQRSLETIELTADLGDLGVRVIDSAGAVVTGVNVSISGPAVAADDVDAQGRADFHNLPPGTYALLARRDGFAHLPTNATIVGGRPTEATIVLEPIRLEVLDAAGGVTTNVKIGLWDRAFDAAGAVLDAVADADNFAGADVRRVQFRVRDVGVTAGFVDIDWRTLDSLRGDLDAPTARPNLTLAETPAGSKNFISRPVILVCDIDDANQVCDSGLVAPLADTGVRNRGQTNHRKRFARMDGFVKAEYAPSSGGQPITVEHPVFERTPEERRRAPMQVFVVRVAAGGAGVVPTAPGSAIFTTDLRVMQETYERIGVRFETVVAPGTPAADIVTQNGLSIVLIDPGAISPLNVSFADEITLGTANPSIGGNTVRVFFVGGLASGAGGEAYSDAISTDSRQGAAYTIQSTGPYAAAHEAGHVLTDRRAAVPTSGHFNPPTTAGTRLRNAQNLMNSGFLGAEGVSGAKRLWDAPDADAFNQFTAIRGSRYTRGF